MLAARLCTRKIGVAPPSAIGAAVVDTVLDTVGLLADHKSELAPACRKSASMLECPFFRVQASGVDHCAPDLFGSAPRSSRKATIARCPHRAARPRGVDR